VLEVSSADLPAFAAIFRGKAVIHEETTVLPADAAAARSSKPAEATLKVPLSREFTR
jgi:hypothetical protein